MALLGCHLALLALAFWEVPSLVVYVEAEKPLKVLSLPWFHVTLSLPHDSGNPLPGFPQLSLLQCSRQLGLSVYLHDCPELEGASGYRSCMWGGPRETRKSSLNLPFY